ncbi:mitotic spindle checkpoint protein MAD1 isoform X2 [Telopea speciosissima]|uniref:mitotic spindle checkpoint protein MAD1 isoform X2 n=1 Tax=Telopea speciosissima TaxID=54955 RepID=UPI001CC4A2B0|nr:mitotic spindle checkpoint protein MAD1 isoform X2 [Telopea speciosissima]
MIIRTPPPRKRKVDSSPDAAAIVAYETPAAASNRPLVIYEDPVPESSHGHDPSEQMLCTYQCRQMVKSKFLDALGSAEKLVHDYQSRLEALNDDLSKAEAEKKKFRDKFYYAEQELAAAKGREQALQEQLLNEVKDSWERLEKQIKSYSELEVKLQKEGDLRKNAELKAASAEDKASLLEEKLRQLSDSIKREKNHLNNELLQLKRESKLSVSRIGSDLERMECRANNAEKESELLKKQLEELNEQMNECLHQKNEVEMKLLNFSSSSGEVNHADTNVLVKHLQEELRSYESEVLEARKLKSSHENNELLREKFLEEKGRRERAESDLLKLQEIQLNVKKLEDELMSWKLAINDIPGVLCPDDLPIQFSGLQKEVLESMMKLGEGNACLKQMEVALEVAEHGRHQAETEAALVKRKAEESLSELSSVSEERERLRKDAYALKKHAEAEGGSANGTPMQELESSLAKKEQAIQELERELNEQKETINCQHNEIKLLTERLSDETRKIKSLEREGDRFRSEIAILESKLSQGDYSAASTKVLRMVNTLAVDSEAKHTIETLRSELQKTKEKLQAVEELKGQSDAGNLIDSQVSEKLAQLKGQVATLEKREERYKTVFAEKISVFRRACCSLFGYKIVMDDHQRPNGIPVTRFTLQSIYAQNDDEKLEFEYESGNTNILENDYASLPEIAQQIAVFIRKMNSIPAFTANLTVESFNRQTLS